MIRLRRGTKYFIIVLVFVIAVLSGLSRADLGNAFSPSRPRIDVRRAEDIFQKADNNRKYVVEYGHEELDPIYNNVQSILKTEVIDTKIMERRAEFFVAVFSLPNEMNDEIMNQLRSIEGFEQEKLSSPQKADFELDIDQHLQDRQLVKRRLESELTETRLLSEDRIERLSGQLTRVQTEIDSLRSLSQKRLTDQNRDLVMIKAVQQTTEQMNTFVGEIKVFSITTLITLVSLIILLLIFYFIFVAVLEVMNIVGIRTLRGSSGGYNYSKSGYGRKVKRIYKKPGDEEKEDKKK